MANKKISELTTRTPSLTDLILVGDPSNGFSYKCTVSALATIIETDIADGYVTLGTTQTISGAKTFSNNLTLTSVANATTDPDKFLVLNGSNIVNYRTGSEVLSDIGGQAIISLTTTGTSGAATFTSNTLNIPQYQGAITLTTTGTSGAATLVGNTLNIPNYAPDLSGYVPTSRTITINGTTQDLTANRTYNVGTVTSVAASGGTGISISGSPITSSGTITITNTAPDQVVALTAGTGISISGTYPNFTITNSSPSLGGTVTSVALSAPTGFAVTGSPITSSGTLALAFDTGYSLPTTASQSNWDTAYTNRITSLTTSGSSGSATLISNTLNIPTYTLAGLGGISLTSLSAVQPLSYNNGTGAFSISQSNTSTDGYLSFTDWNTFNGKIGGSGTTSYVPKFTSSTAIGDSQIYDNGTSVGINTASPNEKLEVSGKFRVSKTTSSSIYLNITAEGSGSEIIFDARGSSDQVFYTQTLERLRIGLGGDITISTIANATIDTDKFLVSDSGVIKYRTGSEILSDIGGQGTLTLTTTGTSGAATLVGNTLNIPQYSGGGGTVSGTTNYIAKFTSSTAVGDSRLFDDGTITFLGNGDVNATPSTGIFSGTGGTGTNIAGAELRIRGGASTGNAAGGIISFYTSAAGTAGTGVNAATERARFTTAGNLGIGTNTSSWGSVFRVLELGNGASIYNWTGGNLGNVTLSSNAYEDASLVSRYINTNGASTYLQNNGEHRWSYAASGTAGNAITYTVGMNLNNSGNLGINTTTIGSRLQVNGNAAIGYSASTAAPTNGLMVAGNVGVNVTPSAWASGFRAIQIGARTALFNSDINITTLGNNIFYDGVSYKYITSAAGSSIDLGGNYMTFGTLASGTAGANATGVERARIHTDGIFYIGNGDAVASPNTGIISATGGSGTNIAGAEFRIRGGASTGSGAGGPITFYTSAAGSAGTGVNAATERMRIISGGNIGIRTTNPFSELEVNSGTGTAPTLKVYSSPSSYTANLAVGIIDLGSNASGNDVPAFRITGVNENAASSATGYATFSTRLSGTVAERMRLTSGGSLGINTSTIGSRLQVNGNAAIGYSASRAASTNGLAIAGNLNVGTGWTTQDAWIEIGTERTGNGFGYIDITTDTTYTDYGLRIIRGNTGANAASSITARGTGGISIITEEAGSINFNTTNTNRLTIPAAGGLTFADANNIAFNTTTGTKIGTATSQKLAFWNATPIVQPTTAVAGAARVGGGGATVTDTDTFGGYTIAQVVQALRNTGILA